MGFCFVFNLQDTREQKVFEDHQYAPCGTTKIILALFLLYTKDNLKDRSVLSLGNKRRFRIYQSTTPLTTSSTAIPVRAIVISLLGHLQ